jgi:transcriptional regulator with XRE-family HTH domain
MSNTPLPNYLRSFRRRDKVNQRDLAILLGCRFSSDISRFEQRERIPTLKIALAYAVVYNASIGELFSGLHCEVRRQIAARVRLLQEKYAKAPASKENEAMVRLLQKLGERLNKTQ